MENEETENFQAEKNEENHRIASVNDPNSESMVGDLNQLINDLNNDRKNSGKKMSELNRQ